MNSENALKEIVKSFIDLANMAKGLVEENQSPSVQQEIPWNLSKADTYGTEVFVRFREVCALERFELKSSQI